MVESLANNFSESTATYGKSLRNDLFAGILRSANAVRAKVKTPFELVVSSYADRHGRGYAQDARWWVGRIGEPLYQCQPPTGYSEKAETGSTQAQQC